MPADLVLIDLFARKARGRLFLSKLPFEEKLVMLDRLRTASTDFVQSVRAAAKLQPR